MGRRQGRHYHSVDFRSLSFPKTGAQVTEKAVAIRDELSKKIEERRARIQAASEKAGLKTGADVLFNLEELNYGLSTAGGGLTAGLSGEIKKEVSAMQQEREEVEKLELIIGNLPPDGQYKLTFSELEYFGF